MTISAETMHDEQVLIMVSGADALEALQTIGARASPKPMNSLTRSYAPLACA